MDFVKEYRTRHPEDDAFSEFADFSQVPLGQKVGILHDLCEWRTENSEVFRKVVGSGEEDSELDWVRLFYLLACPLGWGAQGFVFLGYGSGWIPLEAMQMETNTGSLTVCGLCTFIQHELD